MVAAREKIKLLVIVGPTASGKSDLAMKVARDYNGEIIAADSRTIYKDMDIGTAKPSAKDRKAVPHWGLDLIKPGETFSAARFKEYALDRIADIQKRGRLPILVGGTGLYVDAVIFDFGFLPPMADTRQELEKLSLSRLQQIIKSEKYPMPENYQNRRHLIRTIERQGRIGKKGQLFPATKITGLLPSDETLKLNISKRANAMFKEGIVKETRLLIDKYGEEAMDKTGGIVYSKTRDVINGQLSEEQAKELFKTADWQYARRQKTWFKRNEFIQWYSSGEQAYKELISLLNNQVKNK